MLKSAERIEPLSSSLRIQPTTLDGEGGGVWR
jgi:hypothetical protein